MAAKIGLAKGKCSRCGRALRAPRPATSIFCDCWMLCPLCMPAYRVKMQPFSPDLSPSSYGVTEQGWNIENIMVCYNHTPPYYSSRKPVEVLLT